MKILTSVLLCSALLTVQSAEVTNLRVPGEGLQPQAVVDERGTLHLVYYVGEPGAGELFYVTRAKGADAFSAPIKVNDGKSLAVSAGTIRGAQLAIGKNQRPHVAWMGSTKDIKPVPPAKYPQAPMFYTRLNDAGTTFEPARNLMTHTSGLDGGGSVAADRKGNVYVAWHGHTHDAPEGEAGRAMFLAASADDGKTFAPEKQANVEPTGSCACCGMKAFVDASDRLHLLYRTVKPQSRDMMLLTSDDHGRTFSSHPVNQWFTQSCPMSSSTFANAGDDLLLGTETAGRVEWRRFDFAAGRFAEGTLPTVAESKHPSIAVNRAGETLVAWAEGAGWAKGGTLRWQLYDRNGKAIGPKTEGVALPTWSFAAVTCLDGENFTVIY